MTKEDIIDFLYKSTMNLGIKGIALVMLAAIAVSLIICFTYWLAFRGVAFNIHFAISLCIILLISAVLMMMISSNILISMGMVGALSIVRFRTAIKDSRDTVFVFWAIVEGLCTGSQNNKLAFETTIIIAIVILVLSYIPKGRNKFNIMASGKIDDELVNIDMMIETLKHSCKYVNLKSFDSDTERWTAIIEVKTKHNMKTDTELIDSLRKIPSLENFNIVEVSNL